MALQLSNLVDSSGRAVDAAHIHLLSCSPTVTPDGRTVTIGRIRLRPYASKQAMLDGYSKIELKELPNRHLELKHQPASWQCLHCEAEFEGYERPESCPDCDEPWRKEGEREQDADDKLHYHPSDEQPDDADYIRTSRQQPMNEISDDTLQKLDAFLTALQADMKAANPQLTDATIVADAKLVDAISK